MSAAQKLDLTLAAMLDGLRAETLRRETQMLYRVTFIRGRYA